MWLVGVFLHGGKGSQLLRLIYANDKSSGQVTGKHIRCTPAWYSNECETQCRNTSRDSPNLIDLYT